jgi:hypothetical protein
MHVTPLCHELIAQVLTYLCQARVVVSPFSPAGFLLPIYLPGLGCDRRNKSNAYRRERQRESEDVLLLA